MHVLFCIGWSYRGTLIQIQQYIQAKVAEMHEQTHSTDDRETIPKVVITGDNYDVGFPKN